MLVSDETLGSVTSGHVNNCHIQYLFFAPPPSPNAIGSSIPKSGRDREREEVWYWSLLLRHHGYTGLCIHSHRCVRGDSPVDDWSDILQSSSTIQRQSLLANNNNNNRRTLIDNQVNSSTLHVHSQL